MKKCKRCLKTKPHNEFTKSPSNRDGYMSQCKPCKVELNREYGRTPKGRMSYSWSTQVNSSKARGHQPPAYTRRELYEWALGQGLLDLVEMWKLSGYQKDLTPSVDRLDDSKGYTFDNIRLVTWRENNEKMYTTRKSGERITRQNRKVQQLDLDGNLVAEYPSVAAASRVTGIQRTNINANCSGYKTYEHVGGCLWKYA